MQLGDRKFMCDPLSVLQIPPLCPHSVHNPGQETVVIGWIYVDGWVLRNQFSKNDNKQFYLSGKISLSQGKDTSGRSAKKNRGKTIL